MNKFRAFEEIKKYTIFTHFRDETQTVTVRSKLPLGARRVDENFSNRLRQSIGSPSEQVSKFPSSRNFFSAIEEYQRGLNFWKVSLVLWSIILREAPRSVLSFLTARNVSLNNEIGLTSLEESILPSRLCLFFC